MIHAYNDFYLPIIQNKMAEIFELALVYEKLDYDKFVDMFLNSYISKAFEANNMKYTLGKSSVELFALILNEDPKEYNVSSVATPEYWCGYVLAYIAWYFNVSYKYIFEKVTFKELLMNYFPYHEMDIMHMVDYYEKRLNIPSKLKLMREKRGLSQAQLALNADVPLRTIKSYEQKTVDIGKAQIETIYKLAQELCCKMEDLI
ncbi:MAG: helix-turn-helix domain-containing protein [Acholeplasmatales bacterium]|nr:helix-turn-helix domain-containing protein [Acholeplasmatales bacterium]